MNGEVSKKSMSYKLTTKVECDRFTDKVSSAFDYDFDGITETTLPDMDCVPRFAIGLIVGSSGSGKTQLLMRRFAYQRADTLWDRNKAIVSHFADPDDAVKRLLGCGLASVPTLCKPFHVLSNGEKYRAEIARKLSDGMVLDEFTSEVNRETAKSLSVCLNKYIQKNSMRNIVFSSCHKDIIEWLQPDWVFDCDSGQKFVSEDPRQFLKKVAKIEIY